jgi:hypothetical protein
MDKAFWNWYTQSLGGIIGLVVCLWAYLNGDMAVYGNIFQNLDEIGISGLIASYTLIPLCITITLSGAIESYTKNDNLYEVNKTLAIITTLIGFLGSKIYFIIPAIFILFKFYNSLIYKDKTLEKEKIVPTILNDSKVKKVSYDSTKIYKDKTPDKNLAKIRTEMAVELLLKGADKKFICEITNLTLKELNAIEQKIN